MKKRCSTCNKEIDLYKTPNTICDKCDDLYFCDAWNFTCFSEHVKKNKCGGSHQTILSPEHTFNLFPEHE